tara:strand:- start:9890 stop:10147 length:258 start_codon:yes stop_codon:yes gene_type:complete
MFGWFRKQIDWEMEEYCLNLENRVDSLKRRIADAQLAFENRVGDKKEPTINLPKQQIIEKPKTEIELLKEKLLGKRNKDFYKPVD